jgi:hypothetical protein
MLAYAAAHCPWKEHTHQLRRGGELLTHVFLLMLHFGLSEQYEFTRFDGDEVSVLEFFSSVSIPKSLSSTLLDVDYISCSSFCLT